jgi:hypothetical protein
VVVAQFIIIFQRKITEICHTEQTDRHTQAKKKCLHRTVTSSHLVCCHGMSTYKLKTDRHTHTHTHNILQAAAIFADLYIVPYTDTVF